MGRRVARLESTLKSTLVVRSTTGLQLTAAGAQLLGAACVIVGDLNEERLAQARSFGCETVNVAKGPIPEQIHEILGEPEVDCAVDAVGFEARGCGHDHSREVPAQVLNDCSK